MKKILGIIICGVLLLGITGCGNNETTNQDNNKNSQKENIQNNNDTAQDEKEEAKTFQVGDYEIKYGFYKSKQINVVKFMEDGKCTWNAVDYLYRIEGNYIIVYLQYENGHITDYMDLRVEDETTLVVENKGNDIDTLYYYEVD